MQQMAGWALPGFLGLPSDWSILQNFNIQGVSLFDFPWTSLTHWASTFNNQVAHMQTDPAVLVGYSLGGRLALHALMHQPQQWRAAILVSTHPGLTTQQARQARLQADLVWAKRFETEAWATVIEAWNAQPVFAYESSLLARQEADYTRQQLVHSLVQGSLGQQEDLHQAISELPMPLLWVTGEKDQRYTQLASTLRFRHPLSHHVIIPGGGHRVPWTHTNLFKKIISTFVK